MPWTCVLLVETDQASLALRRFSYEACAAKPHGMNFHDARTYIGVTPIIVSERKTWDVEVAQPPQTDPRWPIQCVCGYVFQEGDTWQLSKNRLYARQDTGALLTLHEVDPGMMWETPWFADEWHGPDGRCYTMALPGHGEWTIDGPSSNGQGWTRSGEPPKLTVTPSILSHGSSTRKGYHGFLTDGVLTDDLEGRNYP
jgi:hypothetical protein